MVAQGLSLVASKAATALEQIMDKEPDRSGHARREQMLRDYAAGEVTWTTLRERGFDNYLEVLAGLGELGLRPPIAPMDGPNREARARGRALIREALKIAP